MATPLGWKRFKFFEDHKRDDVSLPDDVSCSCSDLEGRTWLGCTDGMVIALDSTLSLFTAFRAHQGPIHAITCTQGDKIITLGTNQSTPPPPPPPQPQPQPPPSSSLKTLHVCSWSIAASQSGGTPSPIASVKLISSTRSTPDASILLSAAIHSLSVSRVYIALALSTGAVYLYKGDVAQHHAPQSALSIRSIPKFKEPFTSPLMTTTSNSSTGTSSSTIQQQEMCISLHFASASASSSSLEDSAPSSSSSPSKHQQQQQASSASSLLHLFVTSGTSSSSTNSSSSSASPNVQVHRVSAFSVSTGSLLLQDEVSSSNNDNDNNSSSPLQQQQHQQQRHYYQHQATVTIKGELAVATPDAILFYTAEEGRKAAFALPGRKSGIAAMGRYLVAICPTNDSNSSNSGGGRLPVGQQQSKSSTATATATTATAWVFDLELKIVAASCSVMSPLRWIATFSPSSSSVTSMMKTSSNNTSTINNDDEHNELADCCWGAFSDATGATIRLTERPLTARLEPLFRARAFSLALTLAEKSHAPPLIISNIHKNCGDFYYGKRDYDQAVVHYCATIGYLEPSYVIQQFLDLQRLPALTTYLEVLHDRGLAGADHTTLLLSAYTKMRDVPKLDSFIVMHGDEELASMRHGNSTSTNVVPTGAAAAHSIQAIKATNKQQTSYDSTTAIKVLRAAAYAEHALYVALISADPASYLDILLEDCHQWEQGIQFAKHLPRKQAAKALQMYGKSLLRHVPVETTALLMELCLPCHGNGDNNDKGGINDDGGFVASLADFAHLYSERPEDLRYACVTILNMSPPLSSSNSTSRSTSRSVLYHVLLDLYLGGDGQKLRNNNGGGSTLTLSALSPPPTTMTTSPLPSTTITAQSFHQEALDLLKRGWILGEDLPEYDVDQVMVKCKLHNFQPGLLFLLERKRLYREAAALLGEVGDWDGVLEVCERYGDAGVGGDPALWMDALEYFGSLHTRQQQHMNSSNGGGGNNNSSLSSMIRTPPAVSSLSVVVADNNNKEEQKTKKRDVGVYVKRLVARIEADNILPALVVLHTLARNPDLEFGLLRDYIERALTAEVRAAKEYGKQGDQLKEEIEKTRREVEKLKTEAVVFQSNRDSSTSAPLELPSVHFMCGHSFNLRTLGDAEDPVCPLCAPMHKQVLDLQRSHAASAADKDGFFRQLRTASDGFGVVAEFFGKGILNQTSVTMK